MSTLTVILIVINCIFAYGAGAGLTFRLWKDHIGIRDDAPTAEFAAIFWMIGLPIVLVNILFDTWQER